MDVSRQDCVDGRWGKRIGMNGLGGKRWILVFFTPKEDGIELDWVKKRTAWTKGYLGGNEMGEEEIY